MTVRLRVRDALGDALVALMQEKPFDTITVQDAHAGALMSLLRWWLDRGMRESPAEMDQLFHRIVWNGVTNKSA